jgi:hypothetical protein
MQKGADSDDERRMRRMFGPSKQKEKKLSTGHPKV